MKTAERRKAGVLFVLAGCYAVLGVAAVLLPLLMSQAESPYYHGNRFVYFGLCGGVALAAIAVIELWRRKRVSVEAVLPGLAFFFVSFFFLIFITERWTKSWDYLVYEGAAIAVLQGRELYASGYLYPPLTAQVLEKIYLLSEAVAGFFRLERDWTFSWDVTFYLYQCGQYVATIFCFAACYKFARRAGIGLKTGLVFVTAIYILNDPLLSSLRYNQINLWVLGLILLAILAIDKYPAASGFALSVAGHIKLYPLILLVPWAAMKKRAAVLWAGAGFLGVVILQTGFGTNWKWWGQYLAFLPAVPRCEHFRNTSLPNIVYHFSAFVGRLFDINGASVDTFAKAVIAVGTTAAIIWFGVRFVKREKFLSESARGPVPAAGAPDWQTVRLFSHTVDALTLALLISPRVWEHHYVFALPVIIWAFATRGNDKPWAVGLAAFLILAWPTFDFFILSCHRYVGLLLLAFYTSPVRLRSGPPGPFGALAPGREPAG